MPLSFWIAPRLLDSFHIVLLVGVGVLAGAMATIVGGAAVIVYPALIASGVSPQVAAICNVTALMPASMLAALSDRSQLPPFNRAFVGLIAASVVGAGFGAVLLLLTPERTFSIIVPVLLGFATVLFAYAERISAKVCGHTTAPCAMKMAAATNPLRLDTKFLVTLAER